MNRRHQPVLVLTPPTQRLGRAFGALAAVAALASASPARAQSATTPSPAPQASTAKVSAEVLFDEGRRLMSDGKAADACPKFAESQHLDPSPGTLLNLASCYEKTGRPATAWATYREGASSAAATGRQDLMATAQRHADALYPTLPRVSVTVATPMDGMAIALDGVEVGRAEWGVAVPVDPGEHSIDAVAPHAKTWSKALTIANDAATTSVAVPALEMLPVDATPPPAAPPAAPAPATPPPPPPEDRSIGGTQRAVGLVVGAVGVVGLAVGAGFAASAKSAYSGSLADCRSNAPDECSQPGVNQRNSALNSGNVATVAVTVGALALAGGVVLWLTAPTGAGRSTQSASGVDRAARSADAPSVAIFPTLGGGALRATW